MKELSYHDVRQQLIDHADQLTAYAREIGSDQIDLSEKLPKDEPVSIVIVGNPDVRTHEIVQKVMRAKGCPLKPDTIEGLNCHYTYHPDFPPEGLDDLPDTFASEVDTPFLRKVSLTEVYTKELTGIPPINPVVEQADGVIFVIDARDPWSGRVWKHYENYLDTHRGRVYFYLNRLEDLDQRDWGVLQKHLEEKIVQLSDEKIEIALATDEASFEALRTSFESVSINRQKWNKLKLVTTDLKQAIGDIDATLQEQSIWQANAASFSEELGRDLDDLRTQLNQRVEQSIEAASESLAERANGVIEKTRAAFTTRAYIKSFFQKSVSLEDFYERLEGIVGETLYSELTGCYILINTCVSKHAKSFKENYRQLADQLTKFQGELDQLKVPFILNKDDVKQEMHKTMLEWDVKAIFEEQLENIDNTAKLRLKVIMLFFITAGILGALGVNFVALILLGLGIISVPVVLYLRQQEVNQFCAFLREWFMGFGPRMNQSTELLGEKIVNHAVSYYRECFTKVLNQVKKQEAEMPDRFIRAHKLTVRNEEVVDLLLNRYFVICLRIKIYASQFVKVLV